MEWRSPGTAEVRGEALLDESLGCLQLLSHTFYIVYCYTSLLTYHQRSSSSRGDGTNLRTLLLNHLKSLRSFTAICYLRAYSFNALRETRLDHLNSKHTVRL